MRFCSNCGSGLTTAPPTRCDGCGQQHYVNPKPCGEAVVERDGEILLVRRAQEPWRGHWDVPGGFCDAGEHPMTAARRELFEETGLRAQAVAYIGTWIDDYGPPASDEVQETTANVAYLMVLEAPTTALRLDGNEVAEAAWFAWSHLPTELAFPGHARAMLMAARATAAASSPRPPLLDRPDGDCAISQPSAG